MGFPGLWCLLLLKKETDSTITERFRPFVIEWKKFATYLCIETISSYSTHLFTFLFVGSCGLSIQDLERTTSLIFSLRYRRSMTRVCYQKTWYAMYSQIDCTILRNWRTTYARFISIGITSSHFLQAFCAIAFKSLQCRLINSYFIFLPFYYLLKQTEFCSVFFTSYYNRINVTNIYQFRYSI